MNKRINSFTLHILAMIFMVSDHLWNIFFPNQVWLYVIGRLAFPIFAFMIVEGFFRTKNRKKYLIRIFIFVIISEIPFNLFSSLAIRAVIMLFYPYNNVLWTFLIALCGLSLLEKIEKSKKLNKIIKFVGKIIINFISIMMAYLIKSDYLGYGVITVLIFYFFREKNYRNIFFQAVSIAILNIFIMPEYEFPFNFFGKEIKAPSGAVSMALKFGMPLLLVYNVLNDDNTITIYVSDEIQMIKTGNFKEDVQSNVQLLINKMEDIIRENPTQWMWFHDRWNNFREYKSMKKKGSF